MSVPMPDVSGTEPVADATTGPEVTPDANSGGDGGNNDSGGNNPAWNTLLDKVPSSLHPMLTPVLRDWDSGVQNKLQQVQSQYEPYKPFLETSPDQLEAALGLYRMAEENPQFLYEQMGQYFGLGGGQGQEQQQEENSGEKELDLSALGDLAEHPKFKELMQNQQNMAQLLVNQHQQEEEAKISKQLDTEMEQIGETFPQFKDNDKHQTMIYQIAATQNMTLTDAAKALNDYHSEVTRGVQPPNTPSVLSGNGQIPASTPTDPTKLDSRSTRNLVTQYLQAHKEQG